MVSRRLTDGSGSWTGRSIGGQNILESAYEEAMGLRESVKSLRDDATWLPSRCHRKISRSSWDVAFVARYHHGMSPSPSPQDITIVVGCRQHRKMLLSIWDVAVNARFTIIMGCHNNRRISRSAWDVAITARCHYDHGISSSPQGITFIMGCHHQRKMSLS